MRDATADTLIGFFDEDATEEPASANCRIAGRYEILSLLGVGGMGSVFRVRDLELDETVALKKLRRELAVHPGAVARFRQEVKLARRVTHPNVVRTFDLGEHGEGRFLTMEYVEGRPLSQVLAVEGALRPSAAVALVSGICAGLSAAHRAGVLHQDLKPDNVLVTPDGRAVITDFGIARAAAEVGRSSGLVGTPAYMAPEQVTEPVTGQPVDARADQYALGAVLYELLTGVCAWPGDDPMEVARRRLDHPPPDPRWVQPDIPDDLAAIVLRCMAREPSGRFADVEALSQALASRGAPTLPPAPRSSSAVRAPRADAQGLAVLPLQPSSAEDGWIAEGLTEELIDALSMTPGLRVRPLTAVAAYGAVDPQEAGLALGVAVIATGSVRRMGDELRVSVRLVTVADGYQVWARRAICPPSAALALADTLAQEIATAMTVEIEPNRRDERTDPLAIELYLKGRAEMRTSWHLGMERALELLTHARELAPEHPSILAAYATARARQAFASGDARDVLMAEALAAAEEAARRGPELGEPWMALATARLYLGDSAAAHRSVRDALARSPGLVRAHEVLGQILFEANALDQAEASLRTALSLDPTATHPRWELARLHALRGEWALSDAALGPTITHDDDAAFAQAMAQARVDFWRGVEPRIELEPFRRSANPQAAVVVVFASVLTHVLRSRSLDMVPASATPHVDRMRGRQRWVVDQFVVEARTFVGDLDEAMRGLAALVRDGLQDLAWFDLCPRLAPLRTRPDWQEVRAPIAARAAAVRGVSTTLP